METTKECSRCGEVKTIDAFGVYNKTSIRNVCKRCVLDRAKQRYSGDRNPRLVSHESTEEQRKCYKCQENKPVSRFNTCRSGKGYEEICLACNAFKQRLRTYSLSLQDFKNMMARQDGKCAICCSSEPLVIDHCHENNMVRGLLCSECNQGLGKFKDNAAALNNAIGYLMKQEFVGKYIGRKNTIWK